MPDSTVTGQTGATKRQPYGSQHVEALTSDVIMVTPASAAALRESCIFDRQRTIRQAHVQRLAAEMTNGYFLHGTPIWLCVLPDESMLLVNGQHTLDAIIASGVSVPLTFVYQRVRNEKEASHAYACFDIQRSRSWFDAAKAIGLDDKIPMLKMTLSAMPYIMANFHDTTNEWIRSARQIRFDAMKEYVQAAGLIHGALAGAPLANYRAVMRASVMAVALATAKYQPSTAEDFWSGLVTDDGLRRDDPRKILLRYLTNNTARQKGFDLLRATVLAWNAYFRKDTITILKPGSMVDVYILGTPWSGKNRRSAAVVPLKAPAAKIPSKTLVIGQETRPDGSVVRKVMTEPARKTA